MKYIITENRLNNFIFNYLNKNFKGLELFKVEKHPHIFYVQDDKIIFFYDPETKILYVPNEHIGDILSKYLNLNENEIESILKLWVKLTYNLDISSIGLGEFKNLQKIKNETHNN
jgi:hypothetical protein